MKLGLITILLACLSTATSAQTILLQDDFEAGLGNWTVEQLSCSPYNCNSAVTWQIIDSTHPCASWANPFPSVAHAAWFGRQSSCTYEGGGGTAPHAALKSRVISLPPNAGSIRLCFRSKSYAEDEPFVDTRMVGIVRTTQPQTPIQLGRIFNSNWFESVHDLTPYAGTDIHLWFEFATGDDISNNGRGWYIDNVRVEVGTATGVTFCAGDGTSGAPCPCAHFGASGNGCATSFNPAGARISGAGIASISADTLVLSTTGASPSFLALVQGSGAVAHGQGIQFGDGLLCADSPLIRLAIVFAPGGSVSYPAVGQTPISVAGFVSSPGSLRTYQAWFRDSAIAYCPSATFNLTNGLMLTWGP